MRSAPLHRLPGTPRRRVVVTLAATVLVAGALVPSAPAPSARAAADDFHPAGLGLVFGDEFDGTSLDRSRWCTRYQYGGGAALQSGFADAACTPSGAGTLDFLNDEQQRYRDVNSAGERLHVVRNGFVALRATRTRDDGYASYESAMLRSKQEFLPAAGERLYLTARVRLPDVKGTWPAFWLVPGVRDGKAQWPPEIDILEGPLNRVEDRDTMLHLAAHGKAAGKKTFASSAYDSNGNYVASSSLRGRWLEVGLEWTDASACWFVDGTRILCRESAWVDDAKARANPSPVLLNLAVGGNWAGRHGIEDERLPASFDIDHVRVYSSRATPAPDPAPRPEPVPPPAPAPVPPPAPAPVPPPAPAPPTAPASGVLRGDGSGLCLTQHESGRSATIETCGGAVWTLTAGGRLKTPGGRCLTVFDKATANGSRVGADTCTGSRSQKWRARADGTVVGAASGRCLDVRDAARTPGARVQLWDCHAGPNQRWRLA